MVGKIYTTHLDQQVTSSDTNNIVTADHPVTTSTSTMAIDTNTAKYGNENIKSIRNNSIPFMLSQDYKGAIGSQIGLSLAMTS